jgi:hypothetical protein
MSAVEMARLIRAKKLSARELLAAHLTQIGRVNPKVNAIVTLVPELAAAAAAKADELQARGETLGPLHGLPVAHKDLLDTRGIRTTYGSPLYKDNIPTDDDIVVARMQRAGAITIGKTNTPEFGAGSQHSIRSSARPAIRMTRRRRAVARPVGPPSRWRAGWRRWRVEATRAAPFAIRPHSAMWWASGRRLAASPTRERRSHGRHCRPPDAWADPSRIWRSR